MIAASPASTWTCLFPPDVCYQCDDRDSAKWPWVRELLDKHGGGRRRVRIAIGRSARELLDPDSIAGLVAINCRGLCEPQLRSAGFNFVRRFAVLPDWTRPRWFIPLGSATMSAAAFGLWTPLKLAARQCYRMTRAVARAGLPFWYHDHICLALRQDPPLEGVLQAVFPEHPVMVGISAGSPPPARNRKVTLAIVDSQGQMLAFGKLPGHLPVSEQSVRHEASILAGLRSCPQPVRAPRLLFAGDVGESFLTLASPLKGHQPGLRFTTEHRSFLDSLHTDDVKWAQETQFVASIKARLTALVGQDDLIAAWRKISPCLRRIVMPTTIVHGDFTPWNLREQDGAIAAFDWENAALDGLPLIDEIHHHLAVGYLVNHWTVEQASNWLRAFTASWPRGLGPDTVATLAAVYLLDYLLRLFSEGYDVQYPRMVWCRQILRDIATTLHEESKQELSVCPHA